MTKTFLGLAMALAALAARAQPPAPAAGDAEPPALAAPSDPAPSARPPVPREAVLTEVFGTVREIDRKAHRLGVDTGAGPVTLSLDRNTMVYTAAGLGTVLDLREGVQIRAGHNANLLAYWVQVRTPAATEPPSTPGQGTGPGGGGAAAAGESIGPGAGAPPAPPTGGPGSVPPGGR
jgi:hypothetical protein